MLPVLNHGEALETLGDGRWTDRLLPLYDMTGNLISPVHYGSLKGALVEVSAAALYQTVDGLGQQGVYLQVHQMQVLDLGRLRRYM